jgi:hypothetical protein
MLQLLIAIGRALALGLRGHRELVLENWRPTPTDLGPMRTRSPQLAHPLTTLLLTQRRQRINSARPQRRHTKRGGGGAEHHAHSAQNDRQPKR